MILIGLYPELSGLRIQIRKNYADLLDSIQNTEIQRKRGIIGIKVVETENQKSTTTLIHIPGMSFSYSNFQVLIRQNSCYIRSQTAEARIMELAAVPGARMHCLPLPGVLCREPAVAATRK